MVWTLGCRDDLNCHRITWLLASWIQWWVDPGKTWLPREHSEGLLGVSGGGPRLGDLHLTPLLELLFSPEGVRGHGA